MIQLQILKALMNAAT